MNRSEQNWEALEPPCPSKTPNKVHGTENGLKEVLGEEEKFLDLDLDLDLEGDGVLFRSSSMTYLEINQKCVCI